MVHAPADVSTLTGIREYIVSPLLILNLSSSSASYAYRLAQLDPLAANGSAGTSNPLEMMRNNRLMDSAIAGGVTGGILSVMARESHWECLA